MTDSAFVDTAPQNVSTEENESQQDTGSVVPITTTTTDFTLA
jgi:hypothetical protein